MAVEKKRLKEQTEKLVSLGSEIKDENEAIYNKTGYFEKRKLK